MGNVTLKEILADARDRRYGIPCLLGGNLEMIIAQIKAAEERRSPLILCYNKPLTPNVPIELAMPLMVNAAERATVPVATILDHAMDFDLIVKAIKYGASSVMFDGSDLPYEENVARTREVVHVAHAFGVSVEAEVGFVGGSALETGHGGESHYTDPDQILDFTKRTGIDAMAISFGNVHGKYKGEAKLDLERVKRIRSMTDIPLVMHGGSGLNDQDYRNIIYSGISKVNYYSSMSMGAGINMKTLTALADPYPSCHEIIEWNIEFFFEETKKLLDLLGCSGMASRPDGGEACLPVNSEALVKSIADVVLEVIKGIQKA